MVRRNTTKAVMTKDTNMIHLQAAIAIETLNCFLNIDRLTRSDFSSQPCNYTRAIKTRLHGGNIPKPCFFDGDKRYGVALTMR
jgi:hypothetical protein